MAADGNSAGDWAYEPGWSISDSSRYRTGKETMTENNPLDKVRADEISGRLGQVLTEAGKVIVGQRQMMEGLLLGLITGGHILLEGVPGLAKTLAVSTLARTLDT